MKQVWKLNTPKHIVDFGCGYGFLGLKLLPLLPEGSTYTGINIGEDLLCEARRIFKNAPFHTEFINCDLNKFIPNNRYGGDDLSGVEWDNRTWNSRGEIRKNLVELSLKICIQL